MKLEHIKDFHLMEFHIPFLGIQYSNQVFEPFVQSFGLHSVNRAGAKKINIR